MDVQLGVPKIRGTVLGVRILRTRNFLGSTYGLPILGKYHFCQLSRRCSLLLLVQKSIIAGDYEPGVTLRITEDKAQAMPEEARPPKTPSSRNRA